MTNKDKALRMLRQQVEWLSGAPCIAPEEAEEIKKTGYCGYQNCGRHVAKQVLEEVRVLLGDEGS